MLGAERNLSYYRARYYDPQSGRFTSEDIARFEAGLDFYAYVHNSPVMFIDPMGLQQYPRNFVGPLPPSPGLHYANSVSACENQFNSCKNKAKKNALKGGFIVFVASGIAFDAGIVGCFGIGGPAGVACSLAVEEVQTALTPILIAPFGGNYFDNIADCHNQKSKCLATQTCKK